MGPIRVTRTLPPLSTVLPVASLAALAAVLVLSSTVPEDVEPDASSARGGPPATAAPSPTTSPAEADEVAVAGIMIDISMIPTRRDHPGGLDASAGGGWASTDPPPSLAPQSPRPVSVETPLPAAAPAPTPEPPPVPGVGRPVTDSGSGSTDDGSGDTVVATSG